MIKSLHVAAALAFLASVTAVAAQRPSSGGAAGSPIVPVATIREIMENFTIPSSNAVFEAQSEPPKEADRWAALRSHGLTLAESANLLLLPGRARDTGEWVTFATAMRAGAQAVIKAAEAKDADAFSSASDRLYESCENCHAKYLEQK